jgi:HK97 family phage prohead protease
MHPTTQQRPTKSIRFEVKDASKGIVVAKFATLNVKDFDDDLTLKGAFEEGAAVAISAYGHRSWSGSMPVGKGAIRTDGDDVLMEGQFFLNTSAGKETFEVVKEMGAQQEWSYGFDILEGGLLTEELRQKGVRRVLKKLKVYEVSPVLVGAGVDTTTLSVKEKLIADAAEKETGTDARRELVKFLKTRARLAS